MRTTAKPRTNPGPCGWGLIGDAAYGVKGSGHEIRGREQRHDIPSPVIPGLIRFSCLKLTDPPDHQTVMWRCNGGNYRFVPAKGALPSSTRCIDPQLLMLSITRIWQPNMTLETGHLPLSPDERTLTSFCKEDPGRAHQRPDRNETEDRKKYPTYGRHKASSREICWRASPCSSISACRSSGLIAFHGSEWRPFGPCDHRLC